MVKIKSKVGAFEAKTHFSNLLDRVEKGDRIVITRHGREVAVLAPLRESSLEDRRTMIERALESTKGTSLPKGKTIRDLIYEGRKR
jgi:prevent-host-death family protein